MRLPVLGRRLQEPEARELSPGMDDQDFLSRIAAHTGGLEETVRRVQNDLHAVSARVDQKTDAFQALLRHGEQLATTNDTTESAAASAGEAARRASEAVTDSNRTLGRSLEDIAALTETVAATEQQMADLEAALNGVDGAAETIATIAKQTNLLALNATIEATRAGGQGRGFAVVAEHVKVLAKQAGEATGDIGGILDELREQARHLINAASECSSITATVRGGTDTMQTLLDTVAGNVTRVEETYSEVNGSVEAIDQQCRQVVDGLQGMAEDITTAREALTGARDRAGDLQGTVTRLSTTRADDTGMEETIQQTAAATGELAVHVSDIAGDAARVQERVQNETQVLQELSGRTGELAGATQQVHASAETARETAGEAVTAIREAAPEVRDAVSGLQTMTGQVKDMTQRLGAFEEALQRIRKASGGIAGIAKQTNLLAVNASIEAARSGSAGQGFGVVAEQIGTLAGQTAEATQDIERTLQGLSTSTQALVQRGRDGSERAAQVDEDSRHINGILDTMEEAIAAVRDESGRIRDAATAMEQTSSQVNSGLEDLQQQVNHSATDLDNTNQHLDDLLRAAEKLLNVCNSTGADTDDRRFIEHAQAGARAAGEALEQAIAEGRLSESDVFDRDHVPVADTDPQQYTTRFVAITDDVFPAIQEGILEAHEKILSCCCTDDHGYIGTHNLHTSKPQRPGDPDWNRANSRHRQIYGDRVGQAAAKNREPFLLQAYRRNMGEKIVLTRDTSAPIYVNGRHWGACRVIHLP